MQDKIKSKWDNFDLLLLDDQNQIYKCFELVGIYKEYIDDMDIKEDFEKWYLSCIEEKRYHYRNLGVIETYKWLENTTMQGRTRRYHISKSSMRRYGITYKGSPVVVYEGTYIVLQCIVKHIKEIEEMNRIYVKHIKRDNITDYISFQKKCLDEYIGTAETRRKRYYAEIREQLESFIEESDV